MQVFKCAMRILRSSFTFLLIYVIGFSFVGLLMAFSVVSGNDAQGGEFQRAEYTYALIDRDDSTISRSLNKALAEGGARIEVADDRVAIQDVIAKGHVDYLLIIPKGYESEFLAAHNAEELPKLETIVSYSSLAGSYVDESVNEFVSLLYSLLQENNAPLNDSNLSEITDKALEFASTQANGRVIEGVTVSTTLDQFIFYLAWGMYPLFAGITICIDIMLYKMNRTDVRRRNLSSPLSLCSFNFQLTISCITIALLSVTWIFTLGVIAFPDGVAQLGFERTLLCVLVIIIFSLIPTALGFMIGMFGGNTAVSNSVGNIVGLAISFFGGCWFSLDLMTPAVQDFAHWLPGLWYTQALTAIADASSGAQIDLTASILPAILVMLLFALAFFCIGLVVSKKRAKTTEAGGNRAAEVAN